MSRSALEREQKSTTLSSQDPTPPVPHAPLAVYDSGYALPFTPPLPVIPAVETNIAAVGSVSSAYALYDLSSTMHQGGTYGYPPYPQYQPYPGGPPISVPLPGYATISPFPVTSGLEGQHIRHQGGSTTTSSGLDGGTIEGKTNESEEERGKAIQFPIHGNSGHDFNINRLLFNNIMESDYFKALYQLRTYHETIGKPFIYLLESYYLLL